MDKVFQIATNISTPLMLAGFFAAAFFFITRQIVKANIFPQLTKQLSGEIIKIIIERLFMLALIAMILGFIGYVVGQLKPNQQVSEKTKDHYETPSEDLIKLNLVDITAVDFAPKPETKNLFINLKVIPKSKDKYVPINTKGEFIIIDSTGIETKYSFDINADDEGIKPQLVSYIVFDGLIPKSDYLKIRQLNNYKAKCIVYYDSDVVKTTTKFITNNFLLDRNAIKELSQ